MEINLRNVNFPHKRVNSPLILELLLCLSCCRFSLVRRCDSWTVACQALLSIGFSRQEYKNTGVGCCFLLQGIFPAQGSNLRLLCLLHWETGSLPLGPPRKPLSFVYFFLKNMSTQNNLYAKEAYLGVACSALLQLVSLNTLD